jgi:hypothetical protein
VLEEFDPHVRNCHGKAVVKPNTPYMCRSTKERHPRHIFSNGDDIREERMQGIVCLKDFNVLRAIVIKGAYQHEVSNAFFVDPATEVFMIPARESGPDTVVDVHHTRDTVKTEPVELKLLDPKAQITQKKA